MFHSCQLLFGLLFDSSFCIQFNNFFIYFVKHIISYFTVNWINYILFRVAGFQYAHFINSTHLIYLAIVYLSFPCPIITISLPKYTSVLSCNSFNASFSESADFSGTTVTVPLDDGLSFSTTTA